MNLKELYEKVKYLYENHPENTIVEFYNENTDLANLDLDIYYYPEQDRIAIHSS